MTDEIATDSHPNASKLCNNKLHTRNESSKKTLNGNSDGNKKTKNGVLRKNPNAPRRFKSSYILFFMAKQEDIKRSLPEGSAVS